MPLPTPTSVDEISAPWIEEVLRAAGAISDGRIADVELQPIGAEVGFLSRMAVARVSYDGPVPDAPDSFVVKLEPAAGAFRDAERETRAFEREVLFYHDVAGHLDLRLPRVYHALFSPEASVLVMEDLSHLTSGDQVRGMRHSEVLATVRQIARLHAAFWDNDRLSALDWLPDHDHFWTDGYEANWPIFAREYELRLGPEGLALGESILRHLDWLQARVAERPSSFVHSDLRADNVLLGDPQSDDAAVIVDWQLGNRSMAAIDPTRLLGGSEPAAQRKGHHMEVFTAWHEALLENGVTGYGFEEALEDFRLGALHCLLIPVKAHAFVGDYTSVRTSRLHDAQVERIYVSALELDAQTLLPKS